jgi:hypothetical protein
MANAPVGTMRVGCRLNARLRNVRDVIDSGTSAPQLYASQPRSRPPARVRPYWMPHPKLLAFILALWALAGAVQAAVWLRY